MAQSLSNLPIGAKIKFGKHSVNGETAQPITWLVVAKNHSSTPAYPTNSVTLLTEKIIDLRAFDAREPNHYDSDIAGSGYNDYGVSNIDQWLNSSNTSWYKSAHGYDQAPTNAYVADNTGYDTRPGFLSNFTESERNAILTTTIRFMKYDYGKEDINRKIFLPSILETGIDPTIVQDGAIWSYFASGAERRCLVAPQCYTNTTSTAKPYASTYWNWWTRSANPVSKHKAYVIDNNGKEFAGTTANGSYGVRPAMNLSSTLSISDTTDSDGCYTAVWNSAPPAPTTLTVPTVYGGKSTTISWSKVTDPDGNTVTYQLEQSIGGGAFTTLYSGANLSYSTIVPYGTTSVQFRVKATDSVGASSGYKTSSSITVINNNAPVISGTDSNLGGKTTAFSQTYSVTDANSNTVTITESIDRVSVRSYTATLGATNTFSVAGNTWLKLANGIHTLTITATDGIDTSVRTYTFTKVVTSFTVQKSTAIEASAKPTRIKVSVVKTIPPEATFKVEVCNNGFDSSPTWEDATSVVLSELVYEFKNTTKTATKWGVNIRVTVNRNNGSGACYITSIGGNWE